MAITVPSFGIRGSAAALEELHRPFVPLGGPARLEGSRSWRQEPSKLGASGTDGRSSLENGTKAP
jgi:hypothetical protein